jgi:exopolysaccharide production protein ExoZ
MQQQRTRLDFLDALRGLAILGVLAVHTGTFVQNLPPVLVSMTGFGAIGVQLFFMLSSLTLLSIYSWASFSLVDFYLRRFFRIAPAFYLAGVFYASVWWGLEHVPMRSVIVTLSFAQIWFPDTVESLVPGGWSISVEAAFYIVFPLVLFFLTSLKRAIIATAAAFLIAAAWDYTLRALLSGSFSRGIINDFIYFGFVWNLAAFLLGAVLFHALPLVRNLRLDRRILGGALLFACALLILASMDVQPLRTRAFSLLLLAALTLLVGVTHTPLLVNRAMRGLGEISFSVYLVHWAVLPLAATGVGPLLASAPAPLQWGALFLLVLAVSSLLSTITWKVVEQPGVALGRQIARALEDSALRPGRPGAEPGRAERASARPRAHTAGRSDPAHGPPQPAHAAIKSGA